MSAENSVDISGTLGRLAQGRSLTRDEAATTMHAVMTGAVSEIQLAALLMSLRTRGETVDEVVGFAETMREHSLHVALPALEKPVVDTCGTGGDGHGTFNVSTTAAFVVAGAGVHVAKHGNRAASSQTGSADLLEALGANAAATPEQVVEAVVSARFGFMLAPVYHPAMRYVMPTRRGLGVPTVFNILGPLSNPAGVKRQVIGVRDRDVARLMAGALALLGSERVLVVTSSEGADELTLTGHNYVIDLNGATGEITEYEVDGARHGLSQVPLTAIRGGDAGLNAQITQAILSGKRGAHRDTVVLNAAAGLIAAGIADDFRTAIEHADDAIDSGRAQQVMCDYVAITQQTGSNQ